jgi:hypothetical protein
MTDTELVLEYRKHAAGLRAAAKLERNSQRSLALKFSAVDYDYMAHALEGIAETNRPVGRG